MTRSIRFLLVSLLLSPLFFTAHADEESDQYNFAEGLFIRQDYLSAIEEFRFFLEDFPESAKLAAASFRVGECQMRLKDYKGAITDFSAALKAHPDAEQTALGSYNLGRAHLMLEQYKDANAAFGIASSKGKGEIREEALSGQGECLIKLKDYAAAILIYKEYVAEFASSPEYPDILFSLGWCQSERGLHEAAAANFVKLLEQHPDYSAIDRVKLALADAYTALERHGDAARILQGIKGIGTAGDALLRLAWTQFKAGDKNTAIDSFVKFADDFPDSPQRASALYNAGIASYEIRAFRRAITIFRRLERAAASSQEASDMRLWLGLSLYETKAFDDAITVLAPLVADPGFDAEKRPSLLYSYGEALAAAGKHADAIATFGKVISEFPDSQYTANAFYSKALAEQRAGNVEAAVKTLEGMLATFADSPLRTNALFAIGEYLYRLKRPADALPYLEELAKGEGASPRVLYRLGWAAYEVEKLPQALPAFVTLADGGSEFAVEARFMAGRIAERQDSIPAAIGHYEALIKLPVDEKQFVEKGWHRLAFLYDGDKLAAHITGYRAAFPEGSFANDLGLRQAEDAFQRGDIDDARQKYEALIATAADPEFRRSLQYGLGWCYQKLNKPEKADVAFADSANGDISANLVQDSVLQRGEIAYAAQRFKDAAEQFAKLAPLDSPRSQRALYMLGWSQRNIEQIDASMGSFRTLLQRFPDGEFALDASIRLAESLSGQDKIDDAAIVLKAALAADSAKANEEIHQLYCDTLVKQRNWKDVLTFSDTISERFPNSRQLYLVPFRKGLAYKALGIAEKAEAEFKATIQATETREAAQAQFNIGAIHDASENFATAAKSYLKAEMLYDYDDISPRALYHAIAAFLKAGERYARRVDIYRQKLETEYPDSPWTAKAKTLSASDVVAEP
ncbi:MAG: TolA-binding protein [Rhodothermales bacterium]|jgi:TolA-binding protein